VLRLRTTGRGGTCGNPAGAIQQSRLTEQCGSFREPRARATPCELINIAEELRIGAQGGQILKEQR
jgi:hypothetical protein